MKTVPQCQDYPARWPGVATPRPGCPQPAPGTNPGGQLPLPPDIAESHYAGCSNHPIRNAAALGRFAAGYCQMAYN